MMMTRGGGGSENVEDDSVKEDKKEDEKIKMLIQSTVEYFIQHYKKELWMFTYSTNS